MDTLDKMVKKWRKKLIERSMLNQPNTWNKRNGPHVIKIQQNKKNIFKRCLSS